MIRRLTLAIAIIAVAALALSPGVASAQAGSPPPTVQGTVIEQSPQVDAGSLPRTGNDVIPMIAAGFALLLVGTALIASTRARRRDGSVRLA